MTKPRSGDPDDRGEGLARPGLVAGMLPVVQVEAPVLRVRLGVRSST